MKILIKPNGFFAAILFLLIIGPKTSFAQTVIKITEHDEDNKYLDKKGQPKLTYINPFIVDINSTLQIDIDKTYLKTKMTDSASFALPAATQKLLDQLTIALASQKQALATYSALLKSYNPADATNAKNFNAQVKQVTATIAPLMRDESVLAYLPNTTSGGLLGPVYFALNKRLTEIEGTVLTGNAAAQPSIQFGAWMNTGAKQIPLHLNGFDSLANQEYYTVQRWQFLPTKAQLDQLTQLQKTASENKDFNLSINRASLEAYLNTLFADQIKFAANALNDVTSQVQHLRGDITTIQAPVNKLMIDYQTLVATLSSRVTYYRNLPAADQTPAIINQLVTDISNINSQINTLKADCNQLISAVNALRSQVVADVTNLKNIIKTKADSLFSSVINTDLLSQLNEGYQLDVSTLEFSAKILKLSFKDLPLSTELDLHNTGNRKEGDQIVFKLKVLVNGKDEYAESRVVNMYSVLLHVQGTVGVIFAHPTSHTALVNNFQMVPNYNLLFKGLWPFGENYRRRSVINNKFWDFSWGVHLSSPDFDKDDIPEIGAGVVLSGIKDYFQVGFANDVFLNKWYVFFGVRLPLPFLNLGSTSAAQTVSN